MLPQIDGKEKLVSQNGKEIERVRQSIYDPNNWVNNWVSWLDCGGKGAYELMLIPSLRWSKAALMPVWVRVSGWLPNRPGVLTPDCEGEPSKRGVIKPLPFAPKMKPPLKQSMLLYPRKKKRENRRLALRTKNAELINFWTYQELACYPKSHYLGCCLRQVRPYYLPADKVP